MTDTAEQAFFTHDDLLALRANPAYVDIAYARVDWEAERDSGRTTLGYWDWVDEMRKKNQ